MCNIGKELEMIEVKTDPNERPIPIEIEHPAQVEVPVEYLEAEAQYLDPREYPEDY